MCNSADKGFITGKECMLQKREGSGFVLVDLTYRRPDGAGDSLHQKMSENIKEKDIKLRSLGRLP